MEKYLAPDYFHGRIVCPILGMCLYLPQLVESSVALRYFVLFIGVMNCLYSVWDICDDLVFRKVNESDATAFAKLVGCCPPQVWGVVWLLISIAFFAGGILYVFWLTQRRSRTVQNARLRTKIGRLPAGSYSLNNVSIVHSNSTNPPLAYRSQVRPEWYRVHVCSAVGSAPWPPFFARQFARGCFQECCPSRRAPT